MKVNNRKVRKFKGGGADMGDPGRAQERANKGYGSTASVERPSVKNNNRNNNTVNKTVNNQTANTVGTNQLGTNQLGFTLPSFSALGLGAKMATGIEDARRAKRAKGEYFLTKKKIMPINRDFYRQYGRKLDTSVGSTDEPYMKAAGIIGFPKPNRELNSSNPNTQLCPDGTRPPCKLPTTQIKKPVSTPNTFLTGFQSYDDGGEVIISGNVDKDLL